MKFSGDSTWVISSGDGGTFALFVRDALGISTPTADSIPRLTPPVPRLTGLLYPPELVQDWDRWWRDCSSTGHGREPVGLPVELREAYQQWGAFTTPENTRRRDDIRISFSNSVHELVTDLEQELRRRPVFKLDVVQIPVEGQFWRRLKHDRVLVSEELMASRNVIAPLESVIRDLAQ
ncbi:hypothetical protein [Lentzea flava]|uniref:Uncharacterized protein n=1 Tax=Lentzea flava TaxID=103732 RepID=A0ABQ2U9X6_9PSEU|nr:hypothetical protein [Lentzea flava]MCP2196894.1 hypothetical protein [Lentzea flava]GGU14710.1 hypothetical protein GCM10010178_02720 [Lentzea flava]